MGKVSDEMEKTATEGNRGVSERKNGVDGEIYENYGILIVNREGRHDWWIERFRDQFSCLIENRFFSRLPSNQNCLFLLVFLRMKFAWELKPRKALELDELSPDLFKYVGVSLV